jgi:alpha-L-fucosidase 2
MFRLSRRKFVKALSAAAVTTRVSALTRAASPSAGTDSKDDLTIWFDKPAKEWVDALPLGNGRLGAMVFGGQEGDPANEFLQLNETTFWSGKPHDGNNPRAKDYLPAVRRAVLEEKNYHLADELAQKMQGKHTEAYMPLADLRWSFRHEGTTTQYRRDLDLDTACAGVSYTEARAGEGLRFERQVFSSAPDDVLVLRAICNRPRSLSGQLSLSGALQRTIKTKGTDILLTCKAPAHWAASNHPGGDHPLTFSDTPGEGMYSVTVARVLAEGGATKADGKSIDVEDATSVTVIVAAATGYRGFHNLPDTPIEELEAAALRKLDMAARHSFTQLRQRHIEDYQRLFRRMSLTLGSSPQAGLSTDLRLAGFAKRQDPSLLALYFNYGRYLTIASSRAGSQPANLQGLWNQLTMPPWGCNYTANINLQMNYWPAETCNLSECASPLFGFIHELGVNGEQTATESYGLPGWCAHHNIDIWRSSNAAGEGVGKPTWGDWCMSGPWLCSHLYEHYLFSNDTEFLHTVAYPIMRGAAEFCLAWLIDDGNGHLTTCPSESTENDFLAPDGKPANTSAGCTMDMALIRELFGNCRAAAAVLRVDVDFSQKLAQATERLLPYQIGSHGQLQEWSIDFAESTPGQRHMSHLYPLFPGNQITPRGTPELARAARVSLERRLAAGGAYTGWSRAWAINFWARLGDGDKAGESLAMLMLHSTNRNLFDTHPATPLPIFQIDGNFGATAAMAEMLVQSHTESVDLLPALPAAWPNGAVHGLRARGGLTIDMAWNEGRIATCTIASTREGKHLLRPPSGQRIASIRSAGQTITPESGPAGTFTLHTSANSQHSLTFAR